jgi:meso-butanediol dehydrogenase/(S,S)-butanediol dehydrogenase/diacetyl reductase
MGRAIAVRLAKEGADVAVNDFAQIPSREVGEAKDWEGLNNVIKEIQGLGRRSMAVVADISREKEVDDMVAKIVDKFGKIDVLVNNAGVTGTRGIPLIDLEEKDWVGPLSVMLNGTFHCCRAVGKQMIEKGIKGKIINISSINGKIALPGEGAYDPAKFGIIGLNQALALELAPNGINVNAVCPGIVHTDLALEAQKIRAKKNGISVEEARRLYYEPLDPLIPLGRAGKPEEIANMVAFLASSEADFIVGQAINVCGGFLIAH